eukprot:16440713-Heterocapsa_arctica.AAC.1
MASLTTNTTTTTTATATTGTSWVLVRPITHCDVCGKCLAYKSTDGCASIGPLAQIVTSNGPSHI